MSTPQPDATPGRSRDTSGRPVRSHAEARHLAMPLGGIGTGTVALGADGGLRQWQLHQVGNHQGDLPGSLFAIRVARGEPPLSQVRVLQAPPAPAEQTATPLVTDDRLPDWQRRLAAEHGVAGTTFSGTYPSARIDYDLGDIPLQLSCTALNPLVPLDEATSSLPVAMFTFTLTNPGPHALHGSLAAQLHHAIGYDGVGPIDGVRWSGYGGNTFGVRRHAGWTSLVAENATVAEDHPGAGQLVLAVDQPAAGVLRGLTGVGDVLAHLQTTSSRREQPDPGPSPAGSTWLGALTPTFDLAPGASTTIRVLLAWHLPHRWVDFTQFGPPRPEWGRSRFWLGNHYATQHPDAVAVADDVTGRWEELVQATATWTDLLEGSALTPTETEHLATQAVVLRSPTCFRTADGAFYGFEGLNGASTLGHSHGTGGSCPLNCTHVWNYAQALARLFPGLERSMRETELHVMQAPPHHRSAGAIPHRVVAPAYLPQMWDGPIGGPEEPALDGMLGTLLKTYRELRSGAVDLDWLRAEWPRLELLLDHVRRRWDHDGTGVLTGVQPSTHDIDLRGVNTFMGTLWLAALRAVAEMARLLGAEPRAVELQELFERGSEAYDRICFTGEYYRQVLGPEEPRQYQWQDGCLSDQLIGQWWAHELDLGYLLPVEHVRTALRSVLRYNLRHGFADWHHDQRVFADGADSGLLMCSWPTGGRPEVATRYADEVWSGVEYQVAAHCRREGLVAESEAILAALWARHDGRRRNPFNEIECGDHYVRSMAGWSVLEARTGQSFDAVTRRLRIDVPPAEGDWWPVVTDRGWGRAVRRDGEAHLEAVHGSLDLVHVEWRDHHPLPEPRPGD